MAIRITEKSKWMSTTDTIKRSYLCYHHKKTTGEQIDHSDSYISFAIEFIDTAYTLNSTYENREPFKIFDSLQAANLR
jgi:hypothetical protein